MLFIAIGALATAGSFIFILHSLSPNLLKTVLGYRVWADILLSGSLTLMGLATGTISGLVIGSLSAIAMTLALVFMKKLIGFRKYTKNETTGKREWVEYPGTITADSFAVYIKNLVPRAKALGAKVTSSFSGVTA